MINRKKGKKGIALVEVLIAVGILGVTLVPIFQLGITGIESSFFSAREIKAESLLLEQIEGLRSARDRSWEELQLGSFYVAVENGVWSLVEAETGFDDGIYTKQLQIEEVYRNIADVIVSVGSSGSSVDASTYRVVATVSWRSLRDRTISFEFYLTRFRESSSWIQTTEADFSAGDFQYTRTTLVGDGEIELQGGCAENPQDGPLLFDELFYNTWVIHPSAFNDIRIVDETEGEVYEGEYSLELISFGGADTKFRNVSGVCTLGFTTFEFWVYSTAEIDQTFGLHGAWDQAFEPVTVPPQEWTFISMPYSDVSGDDGDNLDFIFFKPFADYLIGTILYLDNVTLSGGAGGYFLEGTFESAVFDAGRVTVFNRISFTAQELVSTSVGFQVATSNNPDGPWLYYGPGGTTVSNDLYQAQTGEGIWLGNNAGRYLRFKAYLRSDDGQETPILEEVIVNYFL
ncbi:hypothetical protein MUP65_01185 [Patescibacteria group bacterium]|nr:hypothetical protein [Patescibacteria group bacterium]